MYVPFGKSVDDVTFRLSLRQLFLPRLKKTMEHNLCIIIGFKETAKIPNIFVRNMMCIYQVFSFLSLSWIQKLFFSCDFLFSF